MAGFGNMEWCNELKEKANQDADFLKAARWFKGAVGLEIAQDACQFLISEGRVQAVEPGVQRSVFKLRGDREAWAELMDKGTVNRLFRQNRMQIDGDKIEAMRYWKVLWHLTEIARTIK